MAHVASLSCLFMRAVVRFLKGPIPLPSSCLGLGFVRSSSVIKPLVELASDIALILYYFVAQAMVNGSAMVVG